MRYLFITIFFCQISFGQGFRTFKIEDHKFTIMKFEPSVATLNQIATKLGYEPPKFYTYNNREYGNKDVVTVLVKSFSSEPFAVITTEKTNSLPYNFISEYFKDFDKDKHYRPYTIESQLEDGIKNKALTSDYFSKLFNVDIDKEGLFVDKVNDYLLHFKGGILVKFSPADGFSKWTKSFRLHHSDMIDQFTYAASLYFNGNQYKVIDFINEQCEAFANIPDGFLNPALEKFQHPDGYINFKVFFYTFYSDYMVSLYQFQDYTLGQLEHINNRDYAYLDYVYSFDENGILKTSKER
ncbi:hypothetical protein [Flavobacterium sp. NKUCC04_CG]|uniref:hypothetical protein n=1 Tax=Flavobacterium sp. NKUCC04_CG TaxID=2842121 RepID=UPI001C5B0649|nr:hypothetical protein [Flavobacterium sp. NKUCC04_CG]MBW3518321.1 hypothetical protein [Flavobacterium sp. NKUCC04_CG]